MANERSLTITSSGALEPPARSYSEGVLVKCSQCSAELGDHYYTDCPHCGYEQAPNCLCRTCGGKLEHQTVSITANGSGGSSATHVVDSLACGACSTLAVFEFVVDYLLEIAAVATEPVELLSEVGVRSSSRMEVFSPINVSEKNSAVSVQHDGIEIRIGAQSELFAIAAPYFSELDNGLISCIDSLCVPPGPPYTEQQRATIELLLSSLRSEIGTEIERYGEENSNVFKRVVGQLAVWPADDGRIALSLFNAILDESPPGALMNTFRLVEVVLDRWWRGEALRRRTDGNVSSAEFLDFVSGFPRKRLDEKLIARVTALRVPPDPVVHRLATLLSPQSRSTKSVLQAVVQFRHDHAHGPHLGKELILPWEHPDYDACIVALMRLIGCMLDDEGIEPTLPSVTVLHRED